MQFEDQIEGILLTGGRSSRMGKDKAALLVNGIHVAHRTADQLKAVCSPVTVLGRRSIEGALFLEDELDYQGPLVAISRFEPKRPFVFIAACDMPLFTFDLIPELMEHMGSHEVCVPSIEGKVQPLCGIYRSKAFPVARELAAMGERRIMALLDRLDVHVIPAHKLRHGAGAQSANSRAELAQLLASNSAP